MLRRLLVLLIITFPLTSQASDNTRPLHVESEAWENATEADGSGLYWDILRAVYEPEGYRIQHHTSTYMRSSGLIRSQQIDIMVGAYAGELQGVTYPRWHFDEDRVMALALKRHAQPWQGETSLANKHVAYIKGYKIKDYLQTDFETHEFYDRQQVFDLLHQGKLDFFLDAQAEIEVELARDNIQATDYVIHPLKRLKLYFVFTDNPHGQQLSELFDQRFAALLKSGQIKQLFQKWNWDEYPFPQDYPRVRTF